MITLLLLEGAWKWAFLAFLLDEDTFLLNFIFQSGEMRRRRSTATEEEERGRKDTPERKTENSRNIFVDISARKIPTKIRGLVPGSRAATGGAIHVGLCRVSLFPCRTASTCWVKTSVPCPDQQGRDQHNKRRYLSFGFDLTEISSLLGTSEIAKKGKE